MKFQQESRGTYSALYISMHTESDGLVRAKKGRNISQQSRHAKMWKSNAEHLPNSRSDAKQKKNKNVENIYFLHIVRVVFEVVVVVAKRRKKLIAASSLP